MAACRSISAAGRPDLCAGRQCQRQSARHRVHRPQRAAGRGRARLVSSDEVLICAGPENFEARCGCWPRRGDEPLASPVGVGAFVVSFAVGPALAMAPGAMRSAGRSRAAGSARDPRPVIGGVLGLSGAVLQGWLRNCWPSPVIGVSAARASPRSAPSTVAAAALHARLPLAGIAGAAIAVALLMTAVRAPTAVSLLMGWRSTPLLVR